MYLAFLEGIAARRTLLVLCNNSGNGLGGNDLAAPDRAESFPCCGLDAHLFGGKTEPRGHNDLHFFFSVTKPDGVTHDDAVDILYRVPIGMHHVADDAEKFLTRHPFVHVIGWWKVVADISEPGGAEEGVAYGVRHDIGIRMAIEPTLRTIKANTPEP
jgi:hypothetical protein